MNVGGQAVIEGVMMRNKEHYAVAVRTPEGKIKIHKEKSTKFPKYFDFIFIRGALGLGYMLYDGVRALIWSNNQQLGVDEKMTKGEVIGTIVTSMLAAIVIFVVLPFFSARWLAEGVLFDILDGIIRVSLLVGYMAGMSFLPDVKRLFSYHGAEHKTIACYEAKKPLTLNNVKTFSRLHPRCGTSFLFMTGIISIIMFTLIQGSAVVEFVGRIALLPLVGGISYEIIKLSGKHLDNPLVKIIIAPGLLLQKITTNEPDNQQLEVGIASLKAVVEKT